MASPLQAASNPIILGPFLRFLGLLSSEADGLVGSPPWGPVQIGLVQTGSAACADHQPAAAGSRGGSGAAVVVGGPLLLAAGDDCSARQWAFLRESHESSALAAALWQPRGGADGSVVEVLERRPAVSSCGGGCGSHEETGNRRTYARRPAGGPGGPQTTAFAWSETPAVWCVPRSTQPQRLGTPLGSRHG